MTSRRQFIQSSLGSAALVSLSASVPGVLLSASAKTYLNPSERILIVIQLSGGNDGLNTVIPYGDESYYENRFTLAIDQGRVNKVDDHIGFHPALNGFSDLLDNEMLAVVQGVGYPNPNRSHFESMDLWHTAHRFAESSQIGWLGRTIESSSVVNELPAIHYGEGKQPLALGTRNRPVPSITSLEQFKLKTGGNKQLANGILRNLEYPRDNNNPLLGFIHDSAWMALKTSQKMESVVGNDNTDFPNTRLGNKLSAVTKLIESGLPTQIYYVTHGGFDTHSNQATVQEGLLRELGDATAALMRNLNEQGNADRTTVVTFSEFGRRVRENASRGTDHGTAAPLFLVGGRVKAGFVNQHPSLTDLDQGDLKYTVDYRQVYATVLEKWLNVESQGVLGSKFKTIELFEV